MGGRETTSKHYRSKIKELTPSTVFSSATLTLVMSGRGAMSGCGGEGGSHTCKALIDQSYCFDMLSAVLAVSMLHIE